MQMSALEQWREGYRASENGEGRDCWVSRLMIGRGAFNTNLRAYRANN